MFAAELRLLPPRLGEIEAERRASVGICLRTQARCQSSAFGSVTANDRSHE